jgi:hypothetical protein
MLTSRDSILIGLTERGLLNILMITIYDTVKWAEEPIKRTRLKFKKMIIVRNPYNF